MLVYRRVIVSTASCPVRWQASWLGADGLLSVVKLSLRSDRLLPRRRA